MLATLLLTLVCAQQEPLEQRSWIDVTPAGAELVVETRRGSRVVQERPGSGRMVTAPRWQVLDGGLAWIAERIATGDHGGTVMSGKELNNEAVTLYTQGSDEEVFDFSVLGAEDIRVAVADRAPVAVAFVATDTTGAPDYEGVVRVWDTTGNGTPDWESTFPTTQNYYGGGATVSDDGETILAWKADPVSATLLVRAFDRAGNLTASGALAAGSSFHARQARLSDDGSRAYFFVGIDAILWDVASGTEIYRHTIGASFDSHTLSGDGKSFAFGNFGFLEVWTESSPGTWTQAARPTFAGGTYVGRVALDEDGDRLAFTIQRYSPAYDHIEIGLLDVSTATVLWTDSFDAPGTAYQLITSGVRIDAAGESLAGISWGDSFGTTPEGFTYDAAGTRTGEFDTAGSAFGLDLDADGDVFAFGTKGVHANVSGNGGAVTVCDAYEQSLHVLGVPRLGSAVTIEVPDSAKSVLLGVSLNLGSSVTPYGIAELDTATLLALRGPYPVPSGGLSVPYNVPANPAFLGKAWHVQGATEPAAGGGLQDLTNKVSGRILP